MNLRRLFLYDDENILSPRGWTRNIHNAFFSIFLVALLLDSTLEDPLGTKFVGVTWMLPLLLYWIPWYQERYGRFESKSKALGFYSLLWTPFVGFCTFIWKTIRERNKRIFEEKKAQKEARLEAKNVLKRQKELREDIETFKAPDKLKDVKKKLHSQIEEFDSNEIYQDEIEKRRKRLKEIQEDLESLMEQKKEIRREKLHQQLKPYVEKFLDKYNYDNTEQLQKLQEVIKRKEDLKIPLEDLKNIAYQEKKNRQQEAMESLLESHNPKSRKDYIKAFVDEFGKGNWEQKELLFKIIDDNGHKSNLTKREKLEELSNQIETTFDHMRHEKEIKQFEEELGLEEDLENSGISEQEITILRELEEGKTDWSDIKDMDGYEFENFLTNLFEAMGYDARQTAKTGDQGADVIAEKPFEKIAIQAKNTKKKVSNTAVQEVVGSKDYYNCDRAIVVSTAGFTKSAKSLARKTDTELWSKSRIKDEMDKYLNESRV
jgi:hypothetical protein